MIYATDSFGKQYILLLFLTVAFVKHCVTIKENGGLMNNKQHIRHDSIDEVKWEITDFFIKRRESLNLSVRELGKKADVSYTVIYDLEKRSIMPKVETILKLAEALELFVDIKHNNDEILPSLCLIFHKGGCVEQELSLITSYKRTSSENPNEQLQRLLHKKGLHTDEIKEIESFISFKLSQH